MKQKITRSLVALFVLFLFVQATKNTGGPPAGNTGAPVDGGTCTGCHGGAVNPGASFPTLQIGSGVSQYTPGQTYTVTVTATQSGISKFGFQLTALQSGNAMAGTLASTSTQTQVINGAGGRKYIQHTSSGTSASPVGQKVWTFNWTAPASDVGNITFYLATNHTNSNGSTSGDAVYNISQVLTPAPAAGNLATGSVTPLVNCVPASVSVPFTASGTFNAGNVFTAQLSNSLGSFASPTAIGTLTGTTSGTISASIPGGTPAGTGYRIRVISSSPSIIGTDNGVNITLNAAPTVTVSGGNAVCNGSFVNLTASGAQSYSWLPAAGLSATTGASVVANPSTTTTYTLTGTDANGCTGTTTHTVTVANNPTVSITANPSVSVCVGQCVTLTASGAITYIWSPGNTTGSSTSVCPTSTTTYTVTGTQGGCTGTATITVTVNPGLNITATASPQSICLGQGSSTLTASGATTYSWSPASGLSSPNGANVTATPTNTTTYTVTGTGANGCTASATVTVTVNGLPTVTALANPSFICIGGSSTLSASGANNFSWTPATGLSSTNSATVNANPSVTTTYTVTGVSSNGCTSTAAVTVTVNSLPSVSITPTNPTVCTGQSITLTASGASSYVWQPGGGSGSTLTVSPTQATTYTVTGTSISGCTASVTATVTLVQAPSLTINQSTNLVCKNATVTLQASASPTGAVYNWNFDGGTIVSGSGAGPYQVSWPTNGVKNVTLSYSVNNCNGSPQIATVNVVDAPSAPVANCGNTTVNSITFTWNSVLGATSYLVSTDGGATFIPPTANNEHTVSGLLPNQQATIIVRAINDCGAGANSTPVTCTAQNCAAVSFTPPADQTVCLGNTAILTVGNLSVSAAQVNWQPGNLSGVSINVSPTSTTSYTYSVSNPANPNCPPQTGTVTVTVDSPISASLSVSSSSICVGQSTIVTLSGSFSANANVVWNFDGGTASPGNGLFPQEISFTAAGSYSVTALVTEGTCQPVLATVNITVSQPPAAPVVNCQSSTNNSVTFAWNAVAGADGYETSTEGVNFVPTNNTEYTVGGLNVGETVTLVVRATTTGVCGTGELSAPVSCTAQNCTPITFGLSEPEVFLCPGKKDTIFLVFINPAYTVVWNGSGTEIQGAALPSYEVTYSAQPYTVSVSVSDPSQPNCPPITDSFLITPASGCVVSSFSVDQDSICANGQVVVTLNDSPSANATYNWDFNGATVVSGSGAGPYALQWPSSGLKTIALTVTENGSTTPAFTQTVFVASELVLEIVPVNPSSFTSNNGSLLSDATGGVLPIVYKLTLNGSTQTNTSGTFTGLGVGDYTVQATDALGCTDEKTGALSAPFARENVLDPASFSLSPNPNEGVFSLNFSFDNTQSIDIQVFEPTGRLVWTQTILPYQKSAEVVFDEKAVGVYLLKVSTAGKTGFKKFVVR